jgi:hypothetical protein
VSHLERGGFEGRLADEESVHNTAEGPHVGRETVTLLVQHLGGDVVRGPADGPATRRSKAIRNLVAVSGTLLLCGTMWIRVFLGLLDPGIGAVMQTYGSGSFSF